MRTAIVTTTINVPTLLKDYKKLKCDIIVIGDKRTPPETATFCEQNDISYFDVKSQLHYLKRFPELKKYLPYNSIQRRNIGILMAYEAGYEKIVTIDDDNYMLNRKYLKEHKLGKRKICTVSSDTGWFNVCKGLIDKKRRTFYHRGFPLEKRTDEMYILSQPEKKNVVVNAGLWLGDPDIDAMTRLYYLADPIDARQYPNPDIALEIGTWSPFNSQNTALHRDIIPAYFLHPYIGRYDDIWASYVVKKIADHLGDYIAFGRPLVDQKRNVHNYWKDLDKERDMERNTDFINQLQDISLEGADYFTCYKEIAEKLQGFDEYVKGMKIWIKTIQRCQ